MAAMSNAEEVICRWRPATILSAPTAKPHPALQNQVLSMFDHALLMAILHFSRTFPFGRCPALLVGIPCGTGSRVETPIVHFPGVETHLAAMPVSCMNHVYLTTTGISHEAPGIRRIRPRFQVTRAFRDGTRRTPQPNSRWSSGTGAIAITASSWTTARNCCTSHGYQRRLEFPGSKASWGSALKRLQARHDAQAFANLAWPRLSG